MQKPPWSSLTGDPSEIQILIFLTSEFIRIYHRIIYQIAIMLISSHFMAGAENVQSAQKYITGLDARRIAKQPEARYTVY